MSDPIGQFEEQGYCVLRGVYAPALVERALALTNQWHARLEPGVAAKQPGLEKDQTIIYNLQNKDPFFLEMLFHSEAVAAILTHLLNDPWFKAIPADDPNYILRSFVARSSRAKLAMHLDAFVPGADAFVTSAQASIALEDHDEESGCMVVVPGSHRSAEYTTPDAYDEAIPVVARPGDVVVFDGRLWHGTRPNTSGHTRWALIFGMVRWWMKQGFDIPRSLPQAIYETLTDSQKAVLGFCSVPPADETTGFNPRRGYDALPARVADLR